MNRMLDLFTLLWVLAVVEDRRMKISVSDMAENTRK